MAACVSVVCCGGGGFRNLPASFLAALSVFADPDLRPLKPVNALQRLQQRLCVRETAELYVLSSRQDPRFCAFPSLFVMLLFTYRALARW